MKIIKFGGRSLAADQGLDNAIQIVQNQSKNQKIAVVVSAIGDTTDTLEKILEKSKKNKTDMSLRLKNSKTGRIIRMLT